MTGSKEVGYRKEPHRKCGKKAMMRKRKKNIRNITLLGDCD